MAPNTLFTKMPTLTAALTLAVFIAGGCRSLSWLSGQRLAIQPQFERVRHFHDGFAAVRLEGKWGFVDTTGSLVISAQFDGAGRFFGDRGTVCIGDQNSCEGSLEEGQIAGHRWGLIDKRGTIVVVPQFESEPIFSEGYSPVKVGNQWGYIDAGGTMQVKPRFGEAEPFSEGLAAVKIDGKWGFIDHAGQVAIDAHFDRALGFSNGRAHVCTGDLCDPMLTVFTEDMDSDTWHYIDKAGVPLEDALDYAEGLAPKKIGSKWGFVDRANQVAISPQFDQALGFAEHLAPVRVGDRHSGKWGFIDSKGAFVINPQFIEVQPFRQGVTWACIGHTLEKQCRVIDVTGKRISEQVFDELPYFVNGLAPITLNGKRGYVNERGDIIIRPQFEVAWIFSEGFAAIRKDGKWGFLRSLENKQ